MKYVGKILYDSEKIIKKKKWYSIFRLLNKPFWKRIWIDIFKIWKIHRIVTFIKNIKREREKKKRYIERDWWGIVEACRSQKTCFQDRDEAFRGEFFRLPDATQVKREFSFPRSSRSFLRSAAKKKKGKKENRVTGIVVHAHHPRIAIFHEEEEGRGEERKYLVPQIDFLTAARGQLFWTRSRRLCIETNRSSRVIVDKLSFDTASSIRGILYFRGRKSLIVAVFSKSSFFSSIKIRIDRTKNRFLNESIIFLNFNIEIVIV